MRNKKIKPKNKPDASVVFAEIESKIPEDLVLKSIKTKTGIAVYTKYFVKTRPYYIKKQYKILSGGKKKLEYSFYDVFSTIFQGASGKIQEGHQQLIKSLNIQDGAGIYKAICGDIDSESMDWGFDEDEDTSVVAQAGTLGISVDRLKKTNKAKEERLQNKIESLRRFAEYVGVTPSVYFKYFNYKMHEFFRSTEDDKFIVKHCLKYSKFGCRLDPFLETYYYKNRNMFLKLMNSQYSTLIPFILKQNEFSLLKLVKLGLHKNTLNKNNILSKILTYKSNIILLDNLKLMPTGVAKLVTDLTENGSAVPLYLPKWIQYEKQINKASYKNINAMSLWERYVNAIKEVKEMMIFPEVRNYYPETTEMINFAQAYRGETKVSKDPIPLGKFVITKNLMNYIEAIHDVPANFITKEIIEMGRYGLAVQLRFKDQWKPTNIQVIYDIEVEE